MRIDAVIINASGVLEAVLVALHAPKLDAIVKHHLIATLQSRVWWIPEFSNAKIDGLKVSLPNNHHIHIQDGCFHIFQVNMIGSLTETIAAEVRLIEHNFAAMQGRYQDTAIEKVQAYSASARTVPLSFVAYHRASIFLGHVLSIDWDHTSDFRTTCESCLTGVKHLMYGIDHVNGAVLYDALDDTTPVSVKCEMNKIEASIDGAINIRRTPSPYNVLNWFAETFQGAIDMCHVSRLYLRDADGNVVAST